jgi:beta-glucosidase
VARSVTRSVLAIGTVVELCLALAHPARALARFPGDFHWGIATSGYQSEGYNADSNWTRYERNHTSSIQDPYRNSVDFRHRYAQDILLADRLGVNTFRFGIQWSRVEPRRGKWSATELSYYDDVVRRIRRAGMTPMITLDHWTYPGWVFDQGAWDNPSTVEDWLAYARRIVGRYRGQGVIWITINEPSTYITMETSNRGLNPVQIALMREHLIETHRRAYDMIHRLDPGTMVTSNVVYAPGIGAAFDALFLDSVTDKIDLLGFDYYYGASLTNLSAAYGAMGEFWRIDFEPDGIYHALHSYARRFPHLPLYVIENGMATDNGAPRSDGYARSDHLRDHVYWMQRAIDEGVNLIGYNYWSLTDNYEWGSYRPRFGLYTVNVLKDRSLRRRPTDAVATYRQVIRNDGVPSSYVPIKKPRPCSFGNLVETCPQLVPV